MAGQRGQFAAVGGLVQREQNHRQVGLVSEAVKHGFQGAGVVGLHGNVGPLVAAEPPEDIFVVVPEGTGVDLDDQAVIETHPDHLREHLPPEALGFLGSHFAF